MQFPHRPALLGPVVVSLLFSCLLTACQQNPSKARLITEPEAAPSASPTVTFSSKAAQTAADKILASAWQMVNVEQVIVRGSCWDYVDAIFTRAGFARGPSRQVVFASNKAGPYAQQQIRPGDWLYFINHSYGDIEHSSLFIRWEDQSRNLGLMLSYAGENRRERARFRVYDLRSVYKIIRGREL